MRHSSNRFKPLLLSVCLMAVLVGAPLSANALEAIYVGNEEADLAFYIYGQEQCTLKRNTAALQTYSSAGDHDFRDTGLTRGVMYTYRLDCGSRVESLDVTAGEVRGRITRDTNWSGGTWNLVDYVWINGVTLTIDSSANVTAATDAYGYPQYSIQFNGGGVLHVDGAAVSNLNLGDYSYGEGTIAVKNSTLQNVEIIKADNIPEFESNRGACTRYNTSNIQIRMTAANSSLSITDNDLATCAIEVTSTNPAATITISNNTFKGISVLGGSAYSGHLDGTLSITGNTAAGSGLNGYILIRYVRGSFTLEGNTANSVIGLNDLADPSPNVSTRIVKGNASGGVKITSTTSDSVSGIKIQGNTFQNCADPPIYVAGTLRNSEVSGNTSMNCGAIHFDARPAYEGHPERFIENNVVRNNTFSSTSSYLSFHFYGNVKNNKIYNNIFQGTRSAWLDFQNMCTDCTNEWNVPAEPGPNIIGGPSIGGNRWDEPYSSKIDQNKDGFADPSYMLNSLNKDNLPLVPYDVMLGPGPGNPSNEPRHPQGQTVQVEQVKVKNASSTGDVSISSMTFTYQGTGPVADITGVGLYRDSTCSGGEGAQVGTTISPSGNAFAFGGLTETVPKGSEACYLLKYTFQQTVSPCATYGAKIVPSGVSAKIGSNAVALGGEAAGSINAGYPEIEIVGEQNRGGSKSKPLASPLEVKLKTADINTEDYQYWKAEFTVKNVPAGAAGYKFDNNLLKNQVVFDTNYKAATGFTLGDKFGFCEVNVTPEPVVQGFPYSCPAKTDTPLVFNVYAGGIELTAQFDGREGDGVGTFVRTIEAKNKLTAVVKLPPGDARTVSGMTFSLDNGSPVNGESKSANPPTFEATLDMAALKEESNLHVAAALSDNTEMTQDFTFYAISFPEWLNYVNNPQVQTYIKWEFQPEGSRYRVSFTWPGDFIWNRPIESFIPLLGGEDNAAKASFTVSADYYVNQNTGLTGEGKVDFEILGKAGTVEGSVSGQFDREFHLLPGATAKLSTSINFPLPEKTLASKTIIVYGVPITLSLDIGGNFKVFVDGAVVFDDKFKFQNMTFIPGTTLTLDITATASAAAGLAKIGVTGSPTGTLRIKLSYTTAAGLTTEAFGGDIVIPIKVFGSLFWDTVSGELGSTQLGPYTFGDQIGGLAVPIVRKAQATGKRFYSTSSVATDMAGRKLLLWTKDTSTTTSAINPEIACKMDMGSGFSDTALITNNNLFELDPRAAFLSDGNALALWTSNKGAKTLANLNEIFANQDIAYSYFNGTSWSTEARITDDDRADGTVDVAYDASSNKAMALWVRSTSTASSLDKTTWSLSYSTFANQQWSAPQTMAGTDDNAADFMPAIASDNGKFMAVWVRDGDGKLFDILEQTGGGSNANMVNPDCDLYYSIYDTTVSTWSTPARISAPDNYTKLMPGLAARDGRFALAWVQKEGSTDKLYLSAYTSGTWGGPILLDTAEYLIEDPKVSITSENKALITYRKNSVQGDNLYVIEKDMASLTPNSVTPQAALTPQQLTYNNQTDLWLSATATPNGKLFLSSTGIGTDLSPPGIGDNIRAGVLEPIKKATLTKVYSEQASGTPTYTSIDASIGVTVQTAGKLIARASLFGPDNTFITRAESQNTFSTGNQTMPLSFSGRKINASGINGPYTIKDIVIFDASLSPIAIGTDASGFVTAAYTYDQFDQARLSQNKSFYIGKEDTMRIKVVDENASNSAVVQVVSSAMPAPLQVTLNATSQGVFEGTLKFSTIASTSDTIKVEEACIISLTYTDTNREPWFATSMWVSGSNTFVNLYQGWNFVSFQAQPLIASISTLLSDISPDVRVVWGYDNQNKVWLRYRGQGSGAGGQNTLAAIEAGRGYWIYANNPTTISFTGIDVSPTIQLYSGWNLTGYLGAEGADASSSLSTFSDRWIILWGWENGMWLVKINGTSMLPALGRPLAAMNKGKAYWIKMNAAAQWQQ